VAAEHPDVVKKLTGTALAWIKTLPPNPMRNAAIVTGKLPEVSSPEDKGALSRARRGMRGISALRLGEP
jgi:hypothetical protein